MLLGAAVDQVGNGGAVTGGGLGVVAIREEHATVVRTDPGGELRRELGGVGAHGRPERAAAQSRDLHGVIDIARLGHV